MWRRGLCHPRRHVVCGNIPDRSGRGHTLVYLAATPWDGIALAALDANPALGTEPHFEVLDLPRLAATAVNSLIEDLLDDGSRPTLSGYEWAQEGRGFARLLGDWPGATFRTKAAALHAACAAAGRRSTFERAAQRVLAIPALAPVADLPPSGSIWRVRRPSGGLACSIRPSDTTCCASSSTAA